MLTILEEFFLVHSKALLPQVEKQNSKLDGSLWDDVGFWDLDSPINLLKNLLFFRLDVLSPATL